MLNQTRQRVAVALRSLGSLLPRGPERRRDASRLIRPWRADSARTYPSVGLTPSRLLALLQAADAGSPQAQFELFDEMLQKWPRLAAVAQTRRLALTGLDWEIMPAPEDGADATHRDASRRCADFCRSTLTALERFRAVLDHLPAAIGYGLAAAELVWEGGRLVDLVPVPHTRLIGDPHEPWRLRVLTEEDSVLGVPLDKQPAKWVLHKPRGMLGRPFDGGLLRASALLYMAANLSFKDWLVFSQIAGMPLRVAQFEPGTPEAEQQRLLKMLGSLGTDASAVFGKNVDLRFIEPAHSGQRPYEPLQRYCNTEITILWLGQHLTTDMGSSGSRAAAEVHERVREDLLSNDIGDEGYTIRRDLLTPLVRSHFGDGAPVPYFRRALIQSVDTKVLADTLAVAINDLGLRVPQRWVYQSLGIPEPQPDEPVLTSRSAS